MNLEERSRRSQHSPIAPARQAFDAIGIFRRCVGQHWPLVWRLLFLREAAIVRRLRRPAWPLVGILRSRTRLVVRVAVRVQFVTSVLGLVFVAGAVEPEGRGAGAQEARLVAPRKILPTGELERNAFAELSRNLGDPAADELPRVQKPLPLDSFDPPRAVVLVEQRLQALHHLWMILSVSAGSEVRAQFLPPQWPTRIVRRGLG